MTKTKKFDPKRKNVMVRKQKDVFTDPRDGKVYKTVKIEKQVWFAENLNWEGTGVWYGNKKSNGQKYGRLYTWEEAMVAVPPGWHLPTDEEWQELVNFASEDAGTKLKSKAWAGTDDFWFSALPGGYHYSDGDFYIFGDFARWWTSTEGSKDRAYGKLMRGEDGKVYSDDNGKNAKFSVRLVQD